MNILSGVPKAVRILVVLSTIPISTGCGSPSLPKGAVGNFGRYNYSPSVIQTGNIRQFWWCSEGVNPSDTSQNTDAIYYEWINMTTLESYGPALVMAETPGAWDSAYTCNPKVIGGVFKNPLGDGKTYSYAMYYVGTVQNSGVNNSIGVAFSSDGVQWNKYPQPIIPSSTQSGYGVGQPVPYNTDEKSSVTLFYEDSNPVTHHISATSTDGVQFKAQGTLTTNGLDADDPQPGWGDIAHDSTTGEWYAVFNRPLRPPASTGGVVERGQYGIELYKIAPDSLLTGATPWQQLATTDTNAIGFEANFIAGLVRDLYGNLNLASDPTIQMYTSVSYPPPSWQAAPAEAGMSATVGNWILMPTEWVPQVNPAVPFNRYFNGSVHEVTTGWISPDGDFQLQSILGHLYPSPSNGATLPFYACKAGQMDYFVSLDSGCEGQRVLGKNGYAYASPVAGLGLIEVYRCSTGQDHFVSKDPKCEGQKTEEVLGYVLP